jgi:SAM-dependent methyltransferase
MYRYLKKRENLKLQKLNDIRINELHNIIKNLPKDSKNLDLLEIGSGTGIQLKYLQHFFKSVIGIEIKESNYDSIVEQRVIYYDGSKIPFEESSFDIIFSSHVLEHISQFTEFDSEIKRVLKPNGICIHVVPNSLWKFYNTLFHYPFLLLTIFDYFVRKNSTVGVERRGTNTVQSRSIFRLFVNVFVPPLHGENGNRISEICFMSNHFWSKRFASNNWIIDKVMDSDYFVSGHLILPNSLRNRFSKILGSTSTIYFLRKKS